MPTSPLHHIETDRKWCVNKRREGWGSIISSASGIEWVADDDDNKED